MALLMSDSHTAQALVAWAENQPDLRAAVLSLRAQGVAPPRTPRPQAVVL